MDGNKHHCALRAELGVPLLLASRGVHVVMCLSLSCRVTAGCTSIPFGRHTDGWRCRAFRSSPVFVGIKVVQYQGPADMLWDLLVSFKTWYLREELCPEKNVPPNSVIGLNWFKSHQGHMCARRLVCGLSAHCIFTRMHWVCWVLSHLYILHLPVLKWGNDFELLFINEVQSFLFFSWPKMFLHSQNLLSSAPVQARGNWPTWCPYGRKWLVPGRRGLSFQNYHWFPFPCQLQHLFVLQKDKLPFPAGWGVDKVQGYARALQDGAPLEESGLPWNFPPVIAPEPDLKISHVQCSSHPFCKSCFFHGRKQIIWRHHYFYDEKRALETKYTHACMHQHAQP